MLLKPLCIFTGGEMQFASPRANSDPGGRSWGAEYKWMRDGTVTIDKRVNFKVQSAEGELVIATGYFGYFHWKRALCHSK